MKSIETLSRIIIQTLKECSNQKHPLTPETLADALSSDERLAGLRAEMTALERQNGGWENGQAGLALLSQFKSTYAKILSELELVAKKEYVERSSELFQRIQECQVIELLAALGDDLVGFIRIFVSSTLEELDYTSDFLSQLSQHLVGMEKQLFAYEEHNRDTFLSNDTFHSTLLTNTEEMKQALDSTESFESKSSFIAAKLTDIKHAIEVKQQEDEIRLREADLRIAELQGDLQRYKDEVLRTKERADALEKEALLDSLTELHNRRAYEWRIHEDLKRYHRDGQVFSLILLDIDHFKRVNDTFGHKAGDRCLREIAVRVKSVLRTGDFVARYGGEEFVAILEGSSAENACSIAERIRVLIEKTRFYARDKEIPVTISLGVTEVRPTDGDAETLFNRVDEVMYQAKKEGRNRVCLI